MVTVILLNLLRSKYNIHQVEVMPGTILEILDQIKKLHPEVQLEDFEHSVVFVNTNRIIQKAFNREKIHDGDEVVFTHFIGGG